MASARVHNAVLSRVRAWTSLLDRLDPGLAAVLRRDPATVELLAGIRAEALIRTRPASAANLLVLLDHLNLHAQRQLWLAPRRPGEYLVTDSAPVDEDARDLVHRFTADPGGGEFLPWPGRIDQVAVITCDRPDTLAGTLDSYLDNLRRFRRAYVSILVCDDSGPAAGAAVRALVESRRPAGARVSYLGPAQKRQLRATLEAGLARLVPEQPPPEVLDALLGSSTPDGRWHGSAAAQRNWATLLGAGRRVLVCDDDARPEVLDLPLASLATAALAALPALHGATAPIWPGELIEAAGTGHPTAWPSDLLGRLEDTEPALVSAAYTGHPDRRTALWLERFFALSDESVDALGAGAPVRPVRRERPAPAYRKFRGGMYVTSGSLDGVEFAVRRDRNEDFSLALSQQVTSGGRLRPRELDGVHMHHRRGRRHASPFAAHRQEREGNLVNQLIATAYARAGGVADPWQRSARSLAALPAADRLGWELFAEGLAYRRRALAHLHRLRDLPEPVTRQWFRDPSPRRARLLRTGARRLRQGRALPAPVLTECLHALVPEGFASTVDRRAARRELRGLPAPARARAAAALEREAAYLRKWTGGDRPPAVLADRLRAKQELTRQLVAEIEVELGLDRLGLDRDGVAQARRRFAEEVRQRVLADARLFLRALPWCYALREARLRLAV